VEGSALLTAAISATGRESGKCAPVSSRRAERAGAQMATRLNDLQTRGPTPRSNDAVHANFAWPPSWSPASVLAVSESGRTASHPRTLLEPPDIHA